MRVSAAAAEDLTHRSRLSEWAQPQTQTTACAIIIAASEGHALLQQSGNLSGPGADGPLVLVLRGEAVRKTGRGGRW